MSDLTIEEVKKIRNAAHDAIAAFDAALNKKKRGGCNMTGDYYYEQLVARLENREQRITELEAQVEALTPKPTMVSEWCEVYDNTPATGEWYRSLGHARREGSCMKYPIGFIRKDTITHSSGLVEYKLEVEK